MERQCAPVGRPATGLHRIVPLDQLTVGTAGKVYSVGGDVELRRRLLEMGFCNGTQVQVIRRAPLGDPIEYRLRGYHLSLRRDQAHHVRVHPE